MTNSITRAATRWPAVVLSSCLLLFAGCTESEDTPQPATLQPPVGERIYGIDENLNLVMFGAQSADRLSFSVRLTGLQAGESVRGMDFRNTDGLLYVLGTNNRLYTVDTLTGICTPFAVGAFTPAFASPVADVGFDFNPTVERVRVHTSIGENRRLNSADGTSANVDATLFFQAGDPTTGTPSSAACAYTNAIRGTTRPTTTQLFAIDATRDLLYEVVNANSGETRTLGPLGFNAERNVTYDISGRTNVGYTTWVNAGTNVSRLYNSIRTQDLANPRTTLVATLPVVLIALAVPVI